MGGRPRKAFNEAQEETGAIIAQVSLPASIGASIGLKSRQIQNYLSLFRSLDGSVADRIERMNLNLSYGDLDRLAKQEPKAQAELIDRMLIPLDHPDPAILARRITSIAAGLKNDLQKRDDQKWLNQFRSAYGRMSLTEKKGALELLGGDLPAGFSLTTPDDRERFEAVSSALKGTLQLLLDLLNGGEEVSDDRLQDAAQDSLRGSSVGERPRLEPSR